MATVIGGYRAQQGLQIPGTPQIKTDRVTDRVIGNLGASVTSLGIQNQKRAEQREALAAANGYDQLQLRAGQRLQELQDNAPADGAGVHTTHNDFFQQQAQEFLGSIKNEKTREKYAILLDPDTGSNATQWNIKSATAERDLGYKWTKDELGRMREMQATAISMEPDSYEEFLQRGLEVTNNSPIPERDKVVERQKWREIARVAYADTMLQRDPQRLLKELGADPNLLPPDTKFGMVAEAVRWRETGHIKEHADRLKAVSPAGAIGIMQVIPGTGAEIATALGDAGFPHDGTPEEVFEYLSREDVNRAYGEFYLRKQLQDFNYDLEAALIAYNGGPKRAEKWLKNDRDDSVLPKETREYYRAIMERLPGAGSKGVEMAQFFWKGKPQAANSKAFKETNPALMHRVQRAFSAAGVGKIKVVSAFRNKQHNSAVGGAQNSQHTHGNALDIDVSGMPNEKRIEVIQSLSAMGITGIGVYANTIHVDLGTRRAWGPSHSKDSVPKWAAATIEEHMSGTAVAPARSGNKFGGRFADMGYEQRQQYIQRAASGASKRYTDSQKASELEKFEMKNLVEDELAHYLNHGEASGTLDESEVARVLGQSKYAQFLEDRTQNTRIYNAVDGMQDMDTARLDAHADSFKIDAKSPIWTLEQERLYKAVSDEAERIKRQRESAPAEAALNSSAIKPLWDQINSTGPNQVTGDIMQQFVRRMLEKQSEYNIKPESRQPVPRQWALEVGKSFQNIQPPQAGGTATAQDMVFAIVETYDQWERVFGPYTDEVILQALDQYYNIDETVREQAEGLMAAVAGGRSLDKWRRKENLGPGETTEPVSTPEEGRGFLDWIGSNPFNENLSNTDTTNPMPFFTFGRTRSDNGAPAADVRTGGNDVNTEYVQSAIGMLQRSNSKAMRDAILNMWGEDVLDAAMRSVGN